MFGRTAFVAWMFVMALACLGLAALEGSWAWLIGAVVFSVVGYLALRLYNDERESGRRGFSFGFAAGAMVLMIVAMLALFWLQFKA